MTKFNNWEIAVSDGKDQTFSIHCEKVRHRLLIRKQIEVSPRLVPLVKWVFNLIGFNIKLDAELYHGASVVTGCPITVALHHSECYGKWENEGESDDGAIQRADVKEVPE